MHAPHLVHQFRHLSSNTPSMSHTRPQNTRWLLSQTALCSCWLPPWSCDSKALLSFHPLPFSGEAAGAAFTTLSTLGNCFVSPATPATSYQLPGPGGFVWLHECAVVVGRLSLIAWVDEMARQALVSGGNEELYIPKAPLA